jgi:putative transposase
MARFARVVVPGYPHHVTHRGNHRQTVFFSDSDRQVYLRLLKGFFARYSVRTLGYCLMSNHAHLLLVPESPRSLALGVGRLMNDYARWQHTQCNQTGHLWQNRYFSCPVDEDRIWDVLRYVELNPVRAHMVQQAWDWPWSSATAHVCGNDASGLVEMNPWAQEHDPDSWQRSLVEGAIGGAANEQIRIATRTGRPFGSHEFIRHLEKRLGRRLVPSKGGRPKNVVT